MATNQENQSRKGAAKGRSQVYNSATGNYIKRDAETGKFIEVKKDGKPFKGVRKEKAGAVLANPNISKATARKAEKAVVQYNIKQSIRAKSR
ncbi:MAG: hypothetical protein ACKVUS_13900 [Saprospiraceae bacterium]